VLLRREQLEADRQGHQHEKQQQAAATEKGHGAKVAVLSAKC
jgi:hypothetical protein